MTRQAGRGRVSPDVVRHACEAGFSAIDAGRPFGDGFAECLYALGYVYDPASACTCPDSGRHGHAVECGWLYIGGTDVASPPNGRRVS